MKVSDENQTDQSISNQLLKNAFIKIPVATAIISNHSQILAYNQAFQALFQLPDNEQNLPVAFEHISSSFWQKNDLQQYLHFVLEDKAEQNKSVFEWQQEDGSLKYIQVQSQLFQPDLQVSAKLLVTFSDISAVKQIEKEHSERIRHMMHELRNPLSNISLCVELLADSTKENNQEDTDMFLTKASASVQRMKQLINDLNAARKAL